MTARFPNIEAAYARQRITADAGDMIAECLNPKCPHWQWVTQVSPSLCPNCGTEWTKPKPEPTKPEVTPETRPPVEPVPAKARGKSERDARVRAFNKRRAAALARPLALVPRAKVHNG